MIKDLVKWSPHDLSVFLHHAVGYDMWKYGRTPAWKDSQERLIDLGLFQEPPRPCSIIEWIRPDRLTKTGKQFLETLMKVEVMKKLKLDVDYSKFGCYADAVREHDEKMAEAMGYELETVKPYLISSGMSIYRIKTSTQYLVATVGEAGIKNKPKLGHIHLIRGGYVYLNENLRLFSTSDSRPLTDIEDS